MKHIKKDSKYNKKDRDSVRIDRQRHLLNPKGTSLEVRIDQQRQFF